MALLGIKMSVFCSLLSVWGILMLAIMGGLLSIRSVAFAEDFEAETLDEIFEKYDKAVRPFPSTPCSLFPSPVHSFSASFCLFQAGSCWIACGIYGVTLLFSAHQWYLNLSN